jgi:hypothetical protein
MSLLVERGNDTEMQLVCKDLVVKDNFASDAGGGYFSNSFCC